MAAASVLAALRRRIVEIEETTPQPRPGSGSPARSERLRAGRTALWNGAGAAVLPFGLPALDAAFTAGGLPRSGSHEIAGAGPGDAGAALGFALALLARLLAREEAAKALLVQEDTAAYESGGIYGPGLKAFGIDPDRVLLVSVRRAVEALWVVEEALRSGAVAAVLGEMWDGSRLLDLSATRRFNLAARRNRALALLLTRNLLGTSAALTRWRVGSASSRTPSRLLGCPAFSLTLSRNRQGRTGSWTIEWDCHDRAFVCAANPLPLALPARDRPPGETGAQRRAVRALA